MVRETKTCAFCGRHATCEHHLVFGSSLRRLAERDDLKINLCDSCHNLAIRPQDRIHGNFAAEKLSKMLGQSLFERDMCAKGLSPEKAREAFQERYLKNYL